MVPAVGYFWGVVAAGATVAIIGQINGLNKVTFITLVAMFLGMFIVFVFSRVERSSDPVIRLVGYLLLIVSGLAFTFVILTSAWLALNCSPRLFAHIYGVSEVCYGSIPVAPAEKKTEKLYRDFVLRYGVWEGVDEISQEEANHLSKSFEVMSVGGRTIEVRLRNGNGFCPTDGFQSVTGDDLRGDCSSARACVAKLQYSEDGTVERQAYYTQFGDIRCMRPMHEHLVLLNVVYKTRT